MVLEAVEPSPGPRVGPGAIKGRRLVLALAAVEMWERYSFFTLLGLLVLFLTSSSAQGGLGWSAASALRLFAIYSGCVYFSPAIGGWLADRWFGSDRLVIVGSCLMLAGHLLMAAPMLMPAREFQITSLYAALGLLVCGNGLFKPNVTAIIPRIFAQEDPERQRSFTLFWVSINGGSLIAALASGPLAIAAGFHVAFATAGGGMAIALMLFLFLRPHLPPPTSRDTFHASKKASIVPSMRRWLALLAVFLFVFFLCFAQKGGLLTIVTRDLVDRDIMGFTVPVTWITGVNPLIAIMLGSTALHWRTPASPGAIAVYPVVGALFAAASAFGLLLLGLRIAVDGQLLPLWLPIFVIALLTIGELLIWPSGYATVTRFAPEGHTSRYIGFFLLVNAVGFYAAGMVGAAAVSWDRARVVGMLVTLTILAAMMASVLAPTIRRRLDAHVAVKLRV